MQEKSRGAEGAEASRASASAEESHQCSVKWSKRNPQGNEFTLSNPPSLQTLCAWLIRRPQRTLPCCRGSEELMQGGEFF